jgi:hypothetical protein
MVFAAANVVEVEDAPCLVSANFHSGGFGDAGADHVLRGSAPQAAVDRYRSTRPAASRAFDLNENRQSARPGRQRDWGGGNCM